MVKSREEPHEAGDAHGGARVRIGPLAAVPALLSDLGCDPEPLIRGAGFDPEQFTDPDKVISFTAGSRLLASCVEVTGCESLGLLLGEPSVPSSLGLPGFMLRTAPDVGTALRGLLRHLVLHDQGGVPTLEVRGGVAMFGYVIHQQGVQATDQIYDLPTELRRMLLAEQCCITQAAARLRMHERMLNRRLRAQGTSFRRELDSARYEMARYFLAETSMSLAKTAEALAYSDTTAFIRAFKRWSGVTPTQWRGAKAKG